MTKKQRVDTKTQLIRFRCSESERKAIETAANKVNKTFSAYILDALNCSHKKEIVATKESSKGKFVATKEPKQESVATNVATNESLPAWKVKLLKQQEAKKAHKKAR